MDEIASGGHIAVGMRIAKARRSRGLTQRQLAEALGMSPWTVERIESGAVNPAVHLSTIAAVTQSDREWLTHMPAMRLAEPPVDRPATAADLGEAGRTLVLGSIVVLVTIRFFTEVVPVIPRAANFIDIPIFLALGVAAMATPPLGKRPRNYVQVGVPGILFLLLAILSALANSGRTDPAPVLVFVYSFLAPLVVYAAAYRIWPSGNGRALSRLLVGLGLLQFVVVALIGIPRFIGSGNPDFISGTFGTNQYQLVFFLLVIAALLAGIFTLEPRRAIARFVPVLVLGIFGIVLLAQYRALLATMVVTMVAVGILLGRHARGIAISILAVVAFAVVFSFVATRFPDLRLGTTASTLAQSPWSYASQRYQGTLPVRQLYGDDPFVGAIGTGPGTFSSRAWQTFAQADSTSQSNVQGGYAQGLSGGVYRTDIATRYVVPQIEGGEIIEGSAALSAPFSSYLGLLAEVGILGLVLIVAVYLTALMRVSRLTRREIHAANDDDPVPALALATTIGFLTLLQMGILENWLEVTRITFVVWLMLAVVAKEIDSRQKSDE